jgi:hypothetical protein
VKPAPPQRLNHTSFMPSPETVVTCPGCSYAVITFSDAVEILEGGCLCLLCGGKLNRAALENAIDAWETRAIWVEGRAQALEKDEWLKENEWIEGGHDFGDEGEDDDDDESWPGA